MKPLCSILDKRFQYVPAIATSVADTWRRFGWHPQREDQRKQRPVLREVRRTVAIASRH